MAKSPLLDRGVIPILDRSRSRLRMPQEILPEALRQASRQGLASPLATVRMETGGIIVDGRLDPVVAAMLNVIVDASLMITVEVELEGDASTTTVWATPSRSVITSSLDPDLIDIHPVRLPRLPETLTDVIMLRPPETVAGAAISVLSSALRRAEMARANPEAAHQALTEVGLTTEEADSVLSFHARSTRRWHISSTWTGETGPQMVELRGLDAGPRGQWLVDSGEQGRTTFTPQGDGDVLRALRDVMPRRWIGTPLNPRTTT